MAVGMGCLLPPLSSGGARVPKPWLRFHTPLIEPDMQVARIRLSDRTSRLHPRHVVPNVRNIRGIEPVSERGRGLHACVAGIGEDGHALDILRP